VQAYLSVEVHESGEAIVISVEGELDLASAPQLEEAMARAERAGASQLVVDLGRLKFIDMAGVRVLIAAHRRAEEADRRLLLVDVPTQIWRVMALARVDDLLPLAGGPEAL
jgi:anti-sigma B factor antagonist